MRLTAGDSFRSAVSLRAAVVEGNTPVRSDHRPKPWVDASAWSGDGIRQEVFFFRSADDSLFASLTVAQKRTQPLGLIVCSSWGREAGELQPLYRGLSEGMARKGGASLEFHPPGHGDSSGRAEAVTLRRLVDAAIDARAEAERRMKDVEWAFAGIRLGAAIATVAARETSSSTLLLLQPDLDPAQYFADVVRSSRRSSLGGGDTVFGVPLSERTRASAADVDVRGALAGFGGRTLVVSYPPAVQSLPTDAHAASVKGAWWSTWPHLTLASTALDLLVGDR
jgi:hypothetical protein